MLSIITGGGKWVELTIHADPLYQHLLLTAEKKFWRCVRDGEVPHLFGVEPPRPRLAVVRIVDMSASNSWAEFASAYRGSRPAYLEHEAAKAELKKLIPEDAKEAIGHGLRAKRSKSGAVSFDLMDACKAAGVDVQFLGNVWGMDENAAKAAGAAADGVVFPLRTAVAWGGNAPGVKTVMEISKMSDAAGTAYRPVHYIAGVCTALYMKEAVEWAAKNGGATGENVKKGFYQKANWVPAGMDGVCNASTWTDKDHRGTLKVDLYRMKVAGATDAPLNDLVKNGAIKLEKVKTIDLPRKPEWLGW